MEQHVEDRVNVSNPAVPHLEHIFTFLTSWGQVDKFLVQKIAEYDKRFPPRAPLGPIDPGNVYLKDAVVIDFPGDSAPEAAAAAAAAANDGGAEGAAVPPCPPASVFGVGRALRQRLDLPLHRRMNRQSVRNTLSYLYKHMRCGIYVMIRHGKVRPRERRDPPHTHTHPLNRNNPEPPRWPLPPPRPSCACSPKSPKPAPRKLPTDL